MRRTLLLTILVICGAAANGQEPGSLKFSAKLSKPVTKSEWRSAQKSKC